MTALVPIDQAATALSPHMRARMAANKATNSNFADGLRDAFPMLSVKGKVFRVRHSGVETPFLDPNTRQPINYLDVVLINASPNLSKSYYKKGFTDGENEAPDCWSLDGVKPDASVAEKQAVTCANCPMNQFGSRITEAGKPAKACADARRVAVVMPHQLNETEQMLMLLRTAQSSLKNLKTYAQLLERHQIEPAGCITRLTFDYQEAFPKLMFDFVAPLSDAQYDKAVELAEADNTKAMLLAPDFDDVKSLAQTPASTGTLEVKQVSAAPVLADPGVAAAMAATAAAVSTSMQSQVPILGQGIAGGVNGGDPIGNDAWPPAHVVTLPDGKFFDTLTKAFVERPAPVQQTPKLPATVITLPDGKLFDTATGQYVMPEPAPVVQKAPEPVKELDPATMKLPDGAFFNPVVGGYVTGPYKGDPAITPVQAKTTAPVDGEITPPKAKAKRASKTKEETTIDAEPSVTAAPTSLEDLLANLVPPSA